MQEEIAIIEENLTPVFEEIKELINAIEEEKQNLELNVG